MSDILKIGASRFIYGNGVIQCLADEITKYGKTAFVIGGKTTLYLVQNKVADTMISKGIDTEWKLMDEPNSMDFAERLAVMALDRHAKVIVAVGGGKCMDLCKVVSDKTKLPLITVPTSVATCAASSAVSIMYTKENGSYDCSVPKEKEVDSVIADIDIIGDSPQRLFASGIMDSLAKLPEIVNGQADMTYPHVSIFKKMAYINSTFIFDFLSTYGVDVYKNPKKDPVLLRDLVLVNLIITSMVSGFSSGSDQLAVAHGLYDGIRKFFPVESKNALHGEIVAVGILMQIRFNQDGEEKYQQVLNMMKKMNMPLTLAELGVEPTSENIEKLKSYNIMKNNITRKENLHRLNLAFEEVMK